MTTARQFLESILTEEGMLALKEKVTPLESDLDVAQFISARLGWDEESLNVNRITINACIDHKTVMDTNSSLPNVKQFVNAAFVMLAPEEKPSDGNFFCFKRQNPEATSDVSLFKPDIEQYLNNPNKEIYKRKYNSSCSRLNSV